MRLLPLVILVTLGLPPAASAGDCRERLRPLLRDPAADSSALAVVRALCETEAQAGDADANYQRALFDLGLGGNWDPDAALPRIFDAAGRGVPEAQYWLAWQHESGDLLPRDQGLALGWYQRAADARHRLAVARLARAYESGELGLAPDAGLAAQYRARESQCAREDAGRVGE